MFMKAAYGQQIESFRSFNVYNDNFLDCDLIVTASLTSKALSIYLYLL